MPSPSVLAGLLVSARVVLRDRRIPLGHRIVQARAIVWLAEGASAGATPEPTLRVLRGQLRRWRLEVDGYVQPGRELGELEPCPIPDDVAERLQGELVEMARETEGIP